MCCMRWIGAKGHTFGVLLAVQALGDTMSENIILTLLNGQRMGNTYTARFVYEESYNNVYAYGVYTRNGKKTTLKAIKNSLKRMEQKGI